jgi:ribonuclease HII
MPKYPNLSEEKRLWNRGCKYIAGVDEVGCGCWAGPLICAAVILPQDFKESGIKDSKLLTARQREKFCAIIKKKSLAWGIGKVSEEEIDNLGLAKAKRLAVERALNSLKVKPDFVLIDGYDPKFSNVSCKLIIKGDLKVKSIACASIMAKVARDKIMVDMHRKFPVYGFKRNKGYGTEEHQKALCEYGICEIHRRSYKPIAELEIEN